jgi:hypothetical protein
VRQNGPFATSNTQLSIFPGCVVRFAPECEFGANAGLAIARELLEPIKKQFPWISYGDLWTLAGAVAVEEMGGKHSRGELGVLPSVPGAFLDAGRIAALVTEAMCGCMPEGRSPPT